MFKNSPQQDPMTAGQYLDPQYTQNLVSSQFQAQMAGDPFFSYTDHFSQSAPHVSGQTQGIDLTTPQQHHPAFAAAHNRAISHGSNFVFNSTLNPTVYQNPQRRPSLLTSQLHPSMASTGDTSQGNTPAQSFGGGPPPHNANQLIGALPPPMQQEQHAHRMTGGYHVLTHHGLQMNRTNLGPKDVYPADDRFRNYSGKMIVVLTALSLSTPPLAHETIAASLRAAVPDATTTGARAFRFRTQHVDHAIAQAKKILKNEKYPTYGVWYNEVKETMRRRDGGAPPLRDMLLDRAYLAEHSDVYFEGEGGPSPASLRVIWQTLLYQANVYRALGDNGGLPEELALPAIHETGPIGSDASVVSGGESALSRHHGLARVGLGSGPRTMSGSPAAGDLRRELFAGKHGTGFRTASGSPATEDLGHNFPASDHGSSAHATGGSSFFGDMPGGAGAGAGTTQTQTQPHTSYTGHQDLSAEMDTHDGTQPQHKG